MSSVTFRDGFTVDDSAGANGLAGGGHRVRFVPALSHAVDTALESKNWASLTGAIVFDGEYSAKEYAVGNLTTQTGGSAKAWAIDSDSVTVDGSDYSARAHAIGTVIPSGSAKDWAIKDDSGLVSTIDYSAKAYAIGTSIPTGSAKDWAVGTRNIGGLLSARVYADSASSSALSALNAPGTTATSTTSNSIPTTFPDTRTFVIQTGKTIVVGMFMIAASTASPANYMIGQVTAYNSGTGSLTLSVAEVTQTGGTGTFAAWSISLTALANVAGAATLAGNNSLSGQNTFNNATAPIITAKLGPSSTQQHALPVVASDTVALLDATQTIVNKTINNSVVNATSLSYSGEGTTTSVSAFQVPVGTTAQRPTAANGKIRFNTTLNEYEGYNATTGLWSALGGGAGGGGTDKIFYKNDQTVNTSYTVVTGENAMSAGPITIANGVTVTVQNGARWVVV
jgi:hypothetical protein